MFWSTFQFLRHDLGLQKLFFAQILSKNDLVESFRVFQFLIFFNFLMFSELISFKFYYFQLHFIFFVVKNPSLSPILAFSRESGGRRSESGRKSAQ